MNAMVINKLCSEFRKIVINRQSNIIARYVSSRSPRDQTSAPPPNISKLQLNPPFASERITFVPKTLNIDFRNPDSVTNKKIFEIPWSVHVPSIEDPLRRPVQRDRPVIDRSIDLPATENALEKLAETILRIRRWKIKKHKRKKYRKRMQFIWAKIRARRNILKERTFQAKQVEKIKKALAFDAKQYVADRLAILDKERIPMTFRGEILPRNVIKQFIEEKKEQQRRRLNKPRITLD